MRIAAARRRAQGRAVPFIKTESDRESSATSRYGCRSGEVRPGAVSCRQYMAAAPCAPIGNLGTTSAELLHYALEHGMLKSSRESTT
jgi:hypothetical protein